MIAETFEIQSYGLSDKGRRRARNEDSLVLDPAHGLFVVCDGMGGHVGGEVASGLAAQAIVGFVTARAADEWPFERLPALSEPADILRNAALLANRRIAERITSEPGLARMGTTMVAVLLLAGGRVTLAHVGDSRAYLWRQGQLRQLTSDHSWVNEQVQMGALSKSEAERHPFRNIITRALGTPEELSVDVIEETLRAGDWLLLCSDGLTGMVDDAKIAEILATESDPRAACDRLVGAANAAGGDDNITVAVLHAAPARGGISASGGRVRESL